MSTKNLSLLFAPSLFQTDGKGEHEVKVMEDLIDNYVSIFNVSRACIPLCAGSDPQPLDPPTPLPGPVSLLCPYARSRPH